MPRRIRQRRMRTTTAVTRYGWEVQQSSHGWGRVGQSAGGDMAVSQTFPFFSSVCLCSEDVIGSLPFF